ncbi:hypothetical protein ES707_01072 [subsurface metagenome]
MTTREASRKLQMGVETMLRWLKQGVLPPPSFIDNNGVRYFDQDWLRNAKEIVKSKRGNPEGGEK